MVLERYSLMARCHVVQLWFLAMWALRHFLHVVPSWCLDAPTDVFVELWLGFVFLKLHNCRTLTILVDELLVFNVVLLVFCWILMVFIIFLHD